MTARLDPFAAAPALMKCWMSTSLAAVASLEPGAMLAADVSLHADGGGKRPAAGRSIY
jgi:hypothetical protein